VIATGLCRLPLKVYTEPYKADVTLVVGGWNLLNLILAGCALKLQRRCEVVIDDHPYAASIEDVSVGGAQVHIYSKQIRGLGKGKEALLRFQPHSMDTKETLPIIVRRVETSGDLTTIGCQYQPAGPLDHRWIADLIFANSRQWSQFQESRRRNPGIVKGSLIFLSVALYQTSRGLVYFLRGRGSNKVAGEGRAR
jgi:cellulose synthase (UDP-forming)